MSVSLRPLREDEYPRWLEWTKGEYAASMIEHGGVSEEIARDKAERDHASLLTDGLATEGHFLYAVEVDGEVAGSLWLCDRDGDLGRSMFVYGIRLDPPYRGRGVGRAAMLLAEDEARGRGLAAVTLNVFGGNEVARGLYTSLGYREQAIFMRKDL